MIYNLQSLLQAGSLFWPHAFVLVIRVVAVSGFFDVEQ